MSVGDDTTRDALISAALALVDDTPGGPWALEGLHKTWCLMCSGEDGDHTDDCCWVSFEQAVAAYRRDHVDATGGTE